MGWFEGVAFLGVLWSGPLCLVGASGCALALPPVCGVTMLSLQFWCATLVSRGMRVHSVVFFLAGVVHSGFCMDCRNDF